ncbi:spindle assembly checkpoint protein Mad2p [Sporodiniella umbellata]|nr:spindle assembly checkpoint protein Mad2p [Sporodiniella umbellata]
MENDSSISIEGSSELIVRFFECSLINILYQRGIYNAEDFELAAQYGMNTMITINDELKEYIDKIIRQLEVWLKSDSVCKWVIVIKMLDTEEIIERWHFDIVVKEPVPAEEDTAEKKEELKKQSIRQIQGILRQITASVSFLPDLKDECTFKVLVYGDKDIEAPDGWGNSHPHFIEGGGQHLKLKPLTTAKHQVVPFVAYKMDDNL